MPLSRFTDNATSALLQTVNPTVVTGTSHSATLAATKLRSLICVFIGTSGRTDTISSVTDNAGNLYVVGYSSAAGTGGTTAMYFTRNAQPTTVVNVVYSGSTDTKSLFVQEFAGLAQSASVLSSTPGISQGTASGANTVSASWSGTAGGDGFAVCSATLVVAAASLSAGSFYGGFLQQQNASPAFTHAIEIGNSVAGSGGAGLMTASSGAFNCGVASLMYRPAGGTLSPSSQLDPHAFQPGFGR